MSAMSGDGEFGLPSASLLHLSDLRSSFSPGILCILSVLHNASLQLRQAGSSVFLLHQSAAGPLCECVWGENMFCLCVCQSVLQSSVAMATPGTWLRQLCSPALEESCCRRPLCLCSGEMHTHTNNFLNVNQTD